MLRWQQTRPLIASRKLKKRNAQRQHWWLLINKKITQAAEGTFNRPLDLGVYNVRIHVQVLACVLV